MVARPAMALATAMALSRLALAEPADPPAPPAPAEPAAVTTEVWREPRVPLDLHWQILALPERAVELLFSPIGMAVAGFERYRLDLRLFDLLRNDAGTIQVVPRAKLSTGDGLGLGAKLEFKHLAGTDAEIGIGGLVLLNSDYQLDIDYEQTYAWLEGREVEVAVEYELDQDVPYYGLSEESEQRFVISSRQLRALLDAEVTALGATDVLASVELGYLRDELAPGVPGSTEMALDDGAPVTIPGGFGDRVHYGQARAVLTFDTRDTEGLTTRGILAQGKFGGSASVSGEKLSALSAVATVSWFRQLAPENRVLVASGGFGSVTRVRSQDEIPLHELYTLGRKDHLRGYNRARFRDRHGWWSSLEYRWKVFEYQDSNVTLVPAIFVDAGKTAPQFIDLFSTDIKYDGGIALRGEHPSRFLFFIELGASPEGLELGVAIGKDL